MLRIASQSSAESCAVQSCGFPNDLFANIDMPSGLLWQCTLIQVLPITRSNPASSRFLPVSSSLQAINEGDIVVDN